MRHASILRICWWYENGMYLRTFFPSSPFSLLSVCLLKVSGPSMLPTMSASGEWIVEDALTVRFGLKPIRRGELLVLVSPRAPTEHICKRVIGLPGDIVCVDPTGERAPSTEHCLIPKGHIWIQGDNAAGSRDSRYYGPVPIALVRARVVARVWATFLICGRVLMHVKQFWPWSSRTIFGDNVTVLGEV